MFTLERSSVIALVIAGCVAGLACRRDPEPATDAAPAIDAAQARKLVLDKYRALFTGTYYRLDDKYHEYPPLSVDDFHKAVLADGIWDVRCEPLVGYFVTGRVAQDGSWVDLEQVGFANQ